MQKVADSLFKNCASLEKIILPDSVTEIGKDAFADASSLQEIVLSKNLTNIENEAFTNCSLLEKIELPDTIKSMGTYVFENCGLLSEVKLPKFMAGIPSGTFKNCTSLKKIDFPEEFQYIRDNAFEGCDKLESIALPDGFIGIGNAAFKNCKRLASVELKGDYIGDFVFENCMELADVKMQDSIYGIGKSAFLNCTNIANIHISTGLKQIAANMFEGCTFLDNLVIPYGVTDIGDEAFKNCSKLRNISIPENVIKISDNAFSYPEATTVYGAKGSYAEEYAKNKNMIFSVNEAVVENIDFLKENYMVRVGQDVKTAVSILPENANTTLIWTSSDESIATVEDGTVRGIGVGECTITAKSGEIEKSCKIIVKDRLYSFIVTGKSTLQVGDTQQLICICVSDEEKAVNAKEFRWWSDNPNVAAVDQEGNVHALKKGRVKIEAWLLEDTEKNNLLEIEVTEKGDGNDHTHSYQSQITTQPSCATAGVKTYTCAECGNSYTETIPAAGHKYTDTTQNATCTAKGAVIHTCSVCKHSYQEEIAATGHKYTKTTKSPTCTAKGTITYTCSVCKHSYQEMIPAAGHKYKKTTKNPTCTAKGAVICTCSVCKHRYTERTIPATGHRYVTTTVAATMKKNGTITTTCRVCKKKSQTTIYAPKTVALSKTEGVYNGKQQKPKVTVKDSKGKGLRKGRDYTIAYQKDMKKVGKHTVTVKFKGNYRGTAKMYLAINPRGTSISKAAPAENGFGLKWKKQAKEVSGYEVAYSTSSKFTPKSTEVVTVGKGKTSMSVTGLKAKKKYYVRIRTYKTAKGKKYYSDWSKVKSVKTKK